MNSHLAIEVHSLRKAFRVQDHQEVLDPFAKMRRMIWPSFQQIDAVSDLSFKIAPGERVAFLGPNGAGKSTTIKMLSGILQPTAGMIQVLGLSPFKDRKKLAYQIGTVFGHRSQLWQHLPAFETFNLLAKVYDQDIKKHKQRQNELVEIFNARQLILKPVRQLSLGERMKCELIASLLHNPKVLFLDEPSLGLDFATKALIRDLMKSQSKNDGTTLLLTSHDAGDIQKICDRVVIIHQGRLLVDESIQSLYSKFFKFKVVTLFIESPRIKIDLEGVTVIEQIPHQLTIKVEVQKISIEKVISSVLKITQLRDLKVEDQPLEEVIEAIYRRAESSTQI